MLNIIICDDETYVRSNVIKIISRIMMPTDIEYKTHQFTSYNKEFELIMNQKLGKKIYILDIEVSNKSGLDIARRIRQSDWKSIIIILTAHYELAYDAFKNRLMLLDFISKFDNYEDTLNENIKTALKIIDSDCNLYFEFNRIAYKVDFGDILYIVKEELSRKTKIRTFTNEYLVSLPLSEIANRLDNRFCRTHRACIINKENVAGLDCKNGKIIFSNGESINLLSKKYKKEVKNYVFS